MGMELKVTIELGDGDTYPKQLEVRRRFEVNLPWAPGNHNAEASLVEAIGTVVNFGEVIGELHEELTKAYEEKLEKQRLEDETRARNEKAYAETVAMAGQMPSEVQERLHGVISESGEASAPADDSLEARQ